MTYNSFKYSDFNAHVISTRTLKFWFDRYFTQFYVKNLNAPYQVAFAAPIGKEQSEVDNFRHTYILSKKNTQTQRFI